MLTKAEKIEKALNYLSNSDLTNYRIAQDTGITEATIGNYRNKKTRPTLANAEILIKYFSKDAEGESADPAYLVTSSGVKYYELKNGKYLMQVPFVPIKAYARYIDEQRDADYGEPLDEYNFIVDQIGHGNYMAFEIKGDSMDDDTKKSLSNGDVVLGRELNKEHWKDKLRTRDYPYWIIVLDNTILCKEIISHDIEKCTITCHSLNPSPEYTDFDLDLNNVRKMFNIIQRVSSMM